jgi:orotidine-5'-phosphate decarboxylase
LSASARDAVARQETPMSETFIEKLDRIVRERASNLCVGLDPDISRIRDTMQPQVLDHLRRQPISFGFVTTEDGVAPDARMPGIEHLAQEPDIAKDVACELTIAACREFAAAFKPNAAFFELIVAGGVGIPSLVRQAGGGALAIFDGKRGDIGNTSLQYADAIFRTHGYDAVTVNPLMGHDAVEPFLRDPAHGVFLLCLTSNPGADDFLLKGDLYKRIAAKAVEWNRNGNVGLVVGATRPELAAEVRAIAPDLPMLIPGVGAQGGPLGETLDAVGARRNPRFLVNSSRGIMFAAGQAGEEHFAAVARAARELRDEINRACGRAPAA